MLTQIALYIILENARKSKRIELIKKWRNTMELHENFLEVSENEII